MASKEKWDRRNAAADTGYKEGSGNLYKTFKNRENLLAKQTVFSAACLLDHFTQPAYIYTAPSPADYRTVAAENDK